MLNYNDLEPDQLKLIDRLYEYDQSIVYATMGSGKSVCYLTAINELLLGSELNRVLIVAPLNPCKHVWAHEHKKWSHLCDMKVSLAVGSVSERKKVIEGSSNVVVINIENLVWFLDTYKKHNFDALCIDELSKFGSVGNKSVKKLRTKSKSFKHLVGLTGTPVHEGFEKLYSQVLIIDGGARLGTSKDRFLKKYFYSTDYNNYNWELLPDSDTKILNLLSDLFYFMPDYTHSLPELIENTIKLELDSEQLKQYKSFAREYALFVDELGDYIVADNAAVLSGKLEQLANGFLYVDDNDNEKYAIDFNTTKIDYLREYISSLDEQCLLFYTFTHDKTQIERVLNELGISYGTTHKTGVSEFLSGDKQVLLLHPKSAGHGLNLHTGGCRKIVCYSPIWSNDMYKQLVGRLWRRGVLASVSVDILCVSGTVDELKLERVDSKDEYDKAFKRFINDIKKGD